MVLSFIAIARHEDGRVKFISLIFFFVVLFFITWFAGSGTTNYYLAKKYLLKSELLVKWETLNLGFFYYIRLSIVKLIRAINKRNRYINRV